MLLAFEVAEFFEGTREHGQSTRTCFKLTKNVLTCACSIQKRCASIVASALLRLLLQIISFAFWLKLTPMSLKSLARFPKRELLHRYRGILGTSYYGVVPCRSKLGLQTADCLTPNFSSHETTIASFQNLFVVPITS